MLKKLFNWIFNTQEKKDKAVIQEFINIEFRKIPKRTQ